MAKALKVGDRVTVSKTFRFKRDSAEYQQGFKSVRQGQVGQVVGAAEGRFVVVDFNGRQATIASRRLERVEEPPTSHPEKSAEREAPVEAEAETGAKPVENGNYASPAFVTFLSNKLLLGGNLRPEADTVVELRLGELPGDVQQQIKALIQAKLDLSPSGTVTGKRRGRKPKASK